jgi:hypothetical protein
MMNGWAASGRRSSGFTSSATLPRIPLTTPMIPPARPPMTPPMRSRSAGPGVSFSVHSVSVRVRDEDIGTVLEDAVPACGTACVRRAAVAARIRVGDSFIVKGGAGLGDQDRAQRVPETATFYIRVGCPPSPRARSRRLEIDQKRQFRTLLACVSNEHQALAPRL